MTAIAIVLMIFAVGIVWGGLIVSSMYLRARPERTSYPDGGLDDHREDEAPIEHDT